LLLVAVALFLGTLTAPAVAAVGTCGFALAAHSTEALRELTCDGRSPDFAALWVALYRMIPNLEDVNFINATSAGLPVHWSQLGLGGLAIALWSLFFLGG